MFTFRGDMPFKCRNHNCKIKMHLAIDKNKRLHIIKLNSIQ